jgi:hypothetical protein
VQPQLDDLNDYKVANIDHVDYLYAIVDDLRQQVRRQQRRILELEAKEKTNAVYRHTVDTHGATLADLIKTVSDVIVNIRQWFQPN